jgi:hypothetical protein
MCRYCVVVNFIFVVFYPASLVVQTPFSRLELKNKFILVTSQEVNIELIRTRKLSSKQPGVGDGGFGS